MLFGLAWEMPLFQVFLRLCDSPAHVIKIRISVQLKTVFADSVQELVHPRGWSSFASYCSIHTSNIPSSIGSHIIIAVLEKLVDPIADSSMRSR